VDVLVERCAGLDVHRDSVVATVRVPGKRRGTRRGETRTYASTIAGLERMAGWLVGEHAVTLVGMEATGVYWKPVFAVLEPRVECWVLNAQHMHNVPGRKTDVADSAWIAQLIEHGLVRPSFIPPAPVRDLRDLTRLRTAITQERTRAIQRLEKVLQDAGIKLTSVASQAYSKTARAIMSALLAGVSDPVELATLAKGRLRSKTGRLAEALANRFRLTHHGVLVRRLLAHIDSLDEQLAVLDEKITTTVGPVADLVGLLCTIPGVAPNTAHVLLAECGWDMSVFPSPGHLASWAGSARATTPRVANASAALPAQVPNGYASP
jgi:transposase